MIKLQNKKGNAAFSLITFVSVVMLMLSSIGVVQNINTLVTKVQKINTTGYCMNIIEQLTLKEFVEQIEDYTSMIALDETTNTKVYNEMLEEMYSSMTTDEGQAVYVSPQKVVSESTCEDERTINELLSIVSAPEYTEFVGVKPISFDYANPDSFMNFRDKDIMYLAPIEVQVNFSMGPMARMSLYEVSGIYAKYVHQNEDSIILTLHADNAKVRRVKHNEYTLTES